MPLIKGRSKKAFEHNVKAEMDAGKPQDQSLAIAYSVKRKNRKKMAQGGEADAPKATQVIPDKGFGKIIIVGHHKDNEYAEGGEVNESAASEHRPMPEERDKDAKMVSRNSGNKAARNDSWTDRSTVEQAQRPSLTKLSQPKIVKGSTFQTKLRDQENDLQESAGVNEGPQRQPDSAYDEEGANRQGPESRDLKLKMMAAGGMAAEDEDIEARERADEAHLMSRESPSMDEGDADAHSRNEEDQNRQGPDISDKEKSHSLDSLQYHDSMDNESDMQDLSHRDHPNQSQRSDAQPMDEAEEEHHASIAAAIMAKKERQSRLHSDSDEDRMVMMAEGGEINGMDSIYSDHSSQVDLKRNAEEDANMEDQASFDALRKENYSESEGLSQLDSPMDSNEHGDDIDSDDHDMVSKIRSKMAMKRAFR